MPRASLGQTMRRFAQLPSLDTLSVGNGASVASISWTHTAGTLTNGIVIVAVAVAGATTTSNLPTGATYNGVAMTAVTGGAAASPTATSTSRDTNLYYLLNPPAGASTVVVNLTTAASGHATAIASTWNHVDQATPFGTAVTYANASSNAPSAVVATTSTTDLIFAAVASKTFATTPSNLTYVDDWNDAATCYCQIGVHQGSANTDTVGYSWTTAGDNSMVAVPLRGAG